MKIWLDDERPAPEGWEWAKNPKEALILILGEWVDEMSLDHDLGWFVDGKEYTGYDVLCALERGLAAGWLAKEEIPQKISIHSANAGARKKMELAVESLARMRDS